METRHANTNIFKSESNAFSQVLAIHVAKQRRDMAYEAGCSEILFSYSLQSGCQATETVITRDKITYRKDTLFINRAGNWARHASWPQTGNKLVVEKNRKL